jgi:hypothetical protein
MAQWIWIHAIQGGSRKLMFMKRKGIFVLVASLGLVAGCATTAPIPEGPAPPQNLLGSTDELQLITELSIDLANTYGGDQVLVVLGLEDTLLVTKGDTQASCDGTSEQVRPTQDDAATQVQRMQAAGLRVIAMTSRGADCLKPTLQELDSNGFNFQASAWPMAEGSAVDSKTHYENGVFFTSNQAEGPALRSLVESSGQPQPMLIVVADSRQKYLNSVMQSFSTSAIKVHTWRYERENTQIASENAQVASAGN